MPNETNKFEILLKDAIKTELTKRGFHTPFNVKIENKKIIIESEPFQTIPVLFKEISIISFGSKIEDNVDLPRIKNFWVNVNVQYKHFDGGTNGCNLFAVVGKYYNPSEDSDYSVRFEFEIK